MLFIIILVLAIFVPGQQIGSSVGERPEFEDETVSLINALRRNPANYSKLITGYEEYLNNGLLHLPNEKPRRLKEGKPVLTETAGVLNKTSGLNPLCRSDFFDKVAGLQLKDLLIDDSIGHKGLDGSNLSARLRRFGMYSGTAAENITYGANSPMQTVTTMLIDDGVKSRLHRKALLNKDFSGLGAACGINAKQTAICVFVFGNEK